MTPLVNNKEKTTRTGFKPGKSGNPSGRPKGAQNRTTALLKDAILQAATEAGNGSMVEYLTQQAVANPGPFMSLLGKVLPMQIAGDADNPVKVAHEIVLRAVYPKNDADD